MKIQLLAKQKILQFTTEIWKSLDDISNIYIEGSDMGKPEVSSRGAVKFPVQELCSRELY
jgi:hypothetical protein